jgi:hypothetical protein
LSSKLARLVSPDGDDEEGAAAGEEEGGSK